MEAAHGGKGVHHVRGHFSRALLEALWGGAAVEQGGVPASQLKAYLERRTSEISRENNPGFIQNAEIDNSLPAQNEPTFGSALPLTFDVEIHFKSERSGEIVLFGPDDSEIKRGDIASGPWEVKLSFAKHILFDLTSGTIKTIQLDTKKDLQRVDF